MQKNIPVFNSDDAAFFDRQYLVSETEQLILKFPDSDTDLPQNSLVLVSLLQKANPGDAVAVATVKGRAVTGFYRRYGDESAVESLNHRERLRWKGADESAFIRWILPVLKVGTLCVTAKKPRGDFKSNSRFFEEF